MRTNAKVAAASAARHGVDPGCAAATATGVNVNAGSPHSCCRQRNNWLVWIPAARATSEATAIGRKLSPPRPALVWAVLDVAISSALQAAWHYKWLATEKTRVAFRERPWEADDDPDEKVRVLYDYEVAHSPEGDIIKGRLRTDAPDTPGTPRHPAYPSGHSTYSAAASYVLRCLFPAYRTSFNRLANNIGHARIWAGVHWFSDHTAGQLIGREVGKLVIRQLNRSGIVVRPIPTRSVPDKNELGKEAIEFGKKCGTASNNFCIGLARAATAEPDSPTDDDVTGMLEEEEGLMNPSGNRPEDLPPYDEEETDLDVESVYPDRNVDAG